MFTDGNTATAAQTAEVCSCGAERMTEITLSGRKSEVKWKIYTKADWARKHQFRTQD